MKRKLEVTGGKKSQAPLEGLLGFLALLNRVSMSPGVREYCTPGHKAGRGFGLALAVDAGVAVAAAPEEVR